MKDSFIIFLDFDGVLNCGIYYKQLQKTISTNKYEYYKTHICPERISWFNELCSETNSKVVISSSLRRGKSVEELQNILNYCGATFEIIGKTDYTGYERGTEISKWIRDNIKYETHKKHYYDFYNYVIIDDDSDMLLNQKEHFFQTDNYSGLTPTICYKIKRYINRNR